jgi:MFS family permease
LLALPSVSRLLLGMQIARIGQAMVSVTFVLFTLDAYHSTRLAGIVTFCSIFPGLVISPVAGALLDRHGRTRLVLFDLVVAMASLTLIGTLALTGMLSASLLLWIASISSLTAPLSATGLRSLFPLIIPPRLWERVNALDSVGYVTATIIGPPLAASFVALWGGPVAFIIIGVSFGVAAIVLVRTPDPPSQMPLTRPLLIESWQGLTYTWRNATLRGLGFSISFLNLLNGTFTIVVPLLVLERFHLSKTAVGAAFAIQGVTAMISAVIFGRMDSRNRERMMLAVPMIVTGLLGSALVFRSSLAILVFVMAISGLLSGPLDVALFTLRQRRTDPAWTGRAFAVSMSFNYLGTPAGAAIAGILAARSIENAVAFGMLASVVAGVLALALVPDERMKVAAE